MAGEWRDVALQDVTDELTVGYVGPMASQYVDEGVPFLRSMNVEPLRINRNDLKFITPEFHRRIQKSRLTPGDVVIVRTGKPGACSVVPDWLADANCSDLVIVRCGKQLNNRFLAYYINTVASGHVAAHLVGAVQQHFNVASARTLRIHLPSLAEQKAIAAVLGALDDKIEVNRRMSATLEAMARALFQSWFVDFDPVRAKLDGRKPAGLDQATVALFPPHFDHKAEGVLPTGWRATTLGEVIEISDSKRIPLSGREREARKGKYPYHGAASVMDYVDDYLFDGIYALMGEDGSVINEDGTPVLQYVWGKFWVNNHAHVLRGKNGISTEHLLLHLKGCNIAPFVNGAVQPKLNQGNMNRIPFMLPPPEIGQAFAKTIDPLFAQIRANTDQSRTLATVRDTLLPKLLGGELSVAGIESRLEAVT